MFCQSEVILKREKDLPRLKPPGLKRAHGYRSVPPPSDAKGDEEAFRAREKRQRITGAIILQLRALWSLSRGSRHGKRKEPAKLKTLQTIEHRSFRAAFLSSARSRRRLSPRDL